jgi:O-antigen/teichoic acid export membrane protein
MTSKLRQLTKDTALYGISTVVGRFINFILVPFYTNIFQPAQYGIITNIYACIALVSIIFLFGMDTAYLKFAGMAEEDEKPKLFAQAFYPILLVGVVLSVILYFGVDQLASLLGIPAEYEYLLVYMVVILFLDALTAVPFTWLRLKKQALRFSMIKLFNIILTIALNIVLIIVFKLGIAAVLISNLIASIITLLILVPEILTNIRSRIDTGLLKKLLAFGLPYLPSGIASMFMQVIDRPLVEKLAGMKMLGIYQANYRLGIFMMLFVSMFQYAWQPFFLENAKEENAKSLFSSVFTYFAAAGCILLVGLSVSIDDIARIQLHGVSLIGKAYWEGLPIVPVVLLAYLFNGFHVVFSAGLFIKNKSMAFPILMTIGAASNVIANLFLIPIWGIMGAALSTLLSYFLMAVGFYFVSNAYYPIQYEKGKLIRLAVIMIIVAVVYYYLLSIGKLILPVRLILFTAFVYGLFAFRIFNKETFLCLIRSRRIRN